MRKNLYIIFIAMSTSLTGQSIFHDALELQKLDPAPVMNNGKVVFPIGSHTQAAEILKDYTPGATNYGQIERAIASNPFIKLAPDNSVNTQTITSAAGSALKSVGGFNVTTIADGLAKFLVKRTKQELSIAFFERFAEELNTIPELTLLFPNTKLVLDAIGEEVYQYSAYLNSLKEAFELDMDNMLASLDAYITQQYSDQKQIVEPVSGSLYFANLLKNGEHPAEAASKLARRDAASDMETEAYKEFIYALQLFDIFSQSLRSQSDDRYWISRDSLNLLTSDEVALQIYFGLLYQKHKDDETFPSTVGNKVGEYLEAIKDQLDEMKVPIQKVISSAENLDSTIKSMKKRAADGQGVDSYLQLLNYTVTTLEYSKTLASSLGVPDSDLADFDMYLKVLKLLNSIGLDVKEKRYNSAIINLVALSTTLNMAPDVFQGEVLKYGTFVANVAKAESSDEVQAAIEAIALPVGSAAIKKRTKFNVSLNAYVGLSPGYEYLGDTDDWKATFAVHTPVGVAFSWGAQKNSSKCSCLKQKGSHSVFLSAVDIGAFSTFRFNDSETETLPEVSLSNIFAPGLYYVKGLANLPISWGVGGQLGPQLRKVTAEDIETTDELNFTAKVFLSVDIPLINFYTRTR